MLNVNDYLDIWEKWMRGNGGPNGYSKTALGFNHAPSNFAASKDDPEHVRDLREAGYAHVVDACIDSLEDASRLVVYQVRGIRRVWLFPHLTRSQMAERYEQAKAELAALIEKRLPIEVA